MQNPPKRLGASNIVDGGSIGHKGKGKEIENIPPETPKKEKPRVPRALTTQNGPRQTFFDDITPIDPSYNKDHGPGSEVAYQDSHGLSLSPRQVTRDSLVDHMLLSLDQISVRPDNSFSRQPIVDEERLYHPFSDEESFLPNQNFAPRNARGPGHKYSYSSDYDNADDSSRYSGGQISRSRRSNSSSNFQPSLGRTNSKRKENGPFAAPRIQTAQLPSRGLHSRSGKGSKASSANSFDLGYAQVTSSQRWAHGLPGRSSSFDYGTERHIMNSPTSPIARPEVNTPTFDPYDYDAAPTPTIPGGPRRRRPSSPIILPLPEPPLIDPVPKLERKRSSRSSKSGYKGKLSVNNGSVGRFHLKDRSTELPPMPAFSKESAPAPLVGYNKAKDAPPPSPAPVQPPKDRPGFFRRVFGSSKNNLVNVEPTSSHGSSTAAETADRINNKSPQTGTQPKPTSTREPPKEHTHILTKKPSSFFRRRKKSISEATAPVPAIPPAELHSMVAPFMEKPLPSPVSSLRKVMNPYIRTPGRSPIDPHPLTDSHSQPNDIPHLDDRAVRGFSPDYEPDKSATIRTVKPSDHESVDNLGSSYATAQQSFLASPTSPAGFDGARDEHDATFLQDSSDNDREVLNSAIQSEPIPIPERKGSANQVPETRAAGRSTLTERPEVQSNGSMSTLTKSGPISDLQRSPISGDSTTKAGAGVKDEEVVKLTPTKLENYVEKADRVWLEPSSSLEDVAGPESVPPTKIQNSPKRVSGSAETIYQSATSLPILQVEGENAFADEPEPLDQELLSATKAIEVMGIGEEIEDETVLDDNDRDRAKKIYEGNEEFISKEKAAAWLAEDDPIRTRTLEAYLQLYNFTNINILAALRMLCGRLVLKAESQQVDRILVTFSKRWCKCNPSHGFKGTDVVHTICYSLLLLNTDLHLADIDQKMTRSQFVKNAMPTIRKSVADTAPELFEQIRPSILPGKSATFDVDITKQDVSKAERAASIELERPSWRNSFKPPARINLDGPCPTPLDYETPVDDCGPLVKSPFHGTMRTWEVQVEIVLKDFYNSIRNERLPLFGASIEQPHLQAPSTNSLSVFTNGMLRRTPSVLSKSPSESQSYNRGRTAETVRGNGRWANKNRSRPRLYPGSGFGSSRTSFDDQSSMWSPSVSSSTWSKYSLGKTHTSMSVDSFGSSWPHGDYQQSIGFANALSQAIIREESVGSPGSNGSERDEMRVTPLLEDESLELHGAPWAKEGIVKHKHHLESVDKKAKDRNWNEVFAVIEKGYMSLFSFSSKSMRNKPKGKVVGGVVGGGNWQENAQNLGSFLLRQTIASALPPPGYSKARPHVWALSLPTGAVHLFQVGTPDIVKEFVSSANYWSARLSNHPLVGGISNIEYGWSDSIVNNALVTAIHNDSTGNSTRPSSGARSSVQSSLRSSLDQGFTNGNLRTRLPGDKISISDWTPPTQSMRASNLMEQDQLRTLTDYVSGIEEELQKHNQLRSPMLLAFTPRHMNAQKAMANWEKKSSYLLREIVKFRTYIDCLHAAEVNKQKIYEERAARKAELQATAAGDEAEGAATTKAE